VAQLGRFHKLMEASSDSDTQWHSQELTVFGEGGNSACLARPISETWWNLVWCHERCGKPENTTRRQFIKDTVLPIGGKLVACKYPTKVVMLLQNDPAYPQYVLVASWRTAQPFMKTIQEMPHLRPPCFTVVLCAAQRQLWKACLWAQTLPKRVGSVHVCAQDQIHPRLFDGVIEKCFGPIDDDVDNNFRFSELNAGEAPGRDQQGSREDNRHQLPEGNIKKEHCSEEADNDADKCSLPIDGWMGVPPLPFNIPLPETLI